VRVVLPTQRLGVILLEELTRFESAFHPPRVINIDRFVIEVGTSLDDDLGIADDEWCEFLLLQLIRSNQKSRRFLKQGHEHELKQFFNDIDEDGIAGGAFEKLRKELEADVFRNPKLLAHLVTRVDEIEDLYITYHNHLMNEGLETRIRALRRYAIRCEERLEDPEKLNCDGLIYCVGFTTLKPFYLPLVQQFLKKTQFKLWITDQAFRPTAAPHTWNRSAMECESVLEEVLTARHWVRVALSQGVTPHRIGLLVTDEQTYAPLLRQVFEEIPSNIALTESLAQTDLGRWLLFLLNFLQKKRGVDLLSLFHSSRVLGIVPEESVLTPDQFEMFYKTSLVSKRLRNGTHRVAL
jgi:hypothetical protein